MSDGRKIKRTAVKQTRKESGSGRHGTKRSHLKAVRPEDPLLSHLHFLETLLDTIPNPVFYKDTEGHYKGCNEAFARQILGASKETIVGRSLLDCPDGVPREFAKRYHEQDMRLIQEKDTEVHEAKVRCADGVERDFLFSRATYSDASGRVAGMMGVMVDITDRKRSEERFMLAARVASDLIYEWNTSDDSLQWFGDVDGMLGFKPGALSRTIEAWVSRIHPEDRKRLQGAVERHRTSTEPIHEEYRIRHRDGRWLHWVDRATPVLGTDGLPYKWVGVCEDITRRKLAEEAHRESEEKWRALVENSPDIIMHVDRKGKILFINQTVEGLSRDQVIGGSIFDFSSAEDHAIMRKTLKRVFQTGKPAKYESSGLGPKGVVSHYESRAEPVMRDGRVAAVNLVATDITSRVRAEELIRKHRDQLRELVQERTAELTKTNEELQREIAVRKNVEGELKELNKELGLRVKERTKKLEKAYDELKELDRMKDEFLSSVSHEFRTPLTSIRSFSEILLSYDEDAERRKEFLEIINSESQRLTRLVNDLLDLSKIKAGKINWNDGLVYLEEVIGDVLKTQQRDLQAKGLRVALDLCPGLAPVTCDRDRIQQVLLNLLNNAIKFSFEGSEIRIRLKSFKGKRSGETAKWNRVEIADQGAGIARKDMDIIFERFRQGSVDVMKNKPGGTGLGLPICREIIQHYGGNIWVESKKGKGSTFFFTLPVAGTAG